jgi:hypothetical protein
VTGQEVIDVGGIDPAGGAELVAGHSPRLIQLRIVRSETARKLARVRSVKKAPGAGFLSMPPMSKDGGICIG